MNLKNIFRLLESCLHLFSILSFQLNLAATIKKKIDVKKNGGNPRIQINTRPSPRLLATIHGPEDSDKKAVERRCTYSR